jgi:hypothetical protein
VGAVTKTQNLKGNQLPEAPPNKVSLNGLYSWSFEPGKLTLSATYIWKDATYGSLFNRGYAKAPAYNEADFRLTWADSKGRYNVIAYVNNAFDELGYDGQTGTLLRAGTAATSINPETAEVIVRDPSLIAPRTYGIELQYRFQ